MKSVAKYLEQLRQTFTQRSLSVEVTSQVRFCEVLAMWQKLTADYVVSLSAVTGSSAIVQCDTSRPADNEKHTATTEKKKTEDSVDQLDHQRMLWDPSDHSC